MLGPARQQAAEAVERQGVVRPQAQDLPIGAFRGGWLALPFQVEGHVAHARQASRVQGAAEVVAVPGRHRTGSQPALLRGEQVFVRLIAAQEVIGGEALGYGVANAVGVQQIAGRRLVVGLVATGDDEQHRLLDGVGEDGQGGHRPPGVPEDRQEQGSILRGADQHVAVALDEIVSPGTLAARPFALPEAHQHVDVAGVGFAVGQGDGVVLGRLDLAQPAPDFLAVVGAEGVQIGVPVRRQGDGGADAVVRPGDLVDVFDVLVDEAALVESRQEQPTTPVGHPQIVQGQPGPVELSAQDVGEGRNRLDLEVGVGHDARVVGVSAAGEVQFVGEAPRLVETHPHPQRQEGDVGGVRGRPGREHQPDRRARRQPIGDPAP